MANYLDLTVVITPRGDGNYNVRADSTEGQASATLKLPPHLQNMPGGVFGGVPASRGIGSVSPTGQEIPEHNSAAYGVVLFNALFNGDVGSLLVAAASRANYMPNTGVRIRLAMDLRAEGMAEVAALPWELMCRPGERALVLSNKTALVRGLDTAQPINPMPFIAPLRILVLMSNPVGAAALGLDDELTRLKASWAGIDGVAVDFVRPVRQRILDQLRRYDYHVIHYMGHGDFTSDLGGALLMETESGEPNQVTADQFAMVLDNAPLRLVFLNACNTGATNAGLALSPYAGVATALIRERIPAVVAMQFPISDGAAITFAETFYKRIAAGEPVDVAVTEGRKAIYSNSHAEWATPVLYMRSTDGNLFTPVDKAPAPQTNTASVAASAQPEAPGGLDALDGGRQGRREDAKLGTMWRFISSPANFVVLVALAGAVAFLWNKIEPKPLPAAAGQYATANGGAAVNASGAAQVSIGKSGQVDSAPPATPVGAIDPPFDGGQVAEARAGGTAVNASDHAHVRIDADK